MLLQNLEQRIGDWTDDQVIGNASPLSKFWLNIGDLFLQIAPLLKPCYRRYCGSHSRALSVLGECREKSLGFSAFLEDQKRKPEFDRLTLESILIMVH